jgi:hypothetical protein
MSEYLFFVRPPFHIDRAGSRKHDKWIQSNKELLSMHVVRSFIPNNRVFDSVKYGKDVIYLVKQKVNQISLSGKIIPYRISVNFSDKVKRKKMATRTFLRTKKPHFMVEIVGSLSIPVDGVAMLPLALFTKDPATPKLLELTKEQSDMLAACMSLDGKEMK